MALAIAIAVSPGAWFSIYDSEENTVECGLFACHSTEGSGSVPFPEFECAWMNTTIKAWRGEVIVVAVFSLVAGGLYLLAMLKPSAAHGMRIGALVLTVLNMVLASVFVVTMILVVWGSWGEDCFGSAMDGTTQSISDYPGFSMGPGLSLMSVLFAIALFGSIVHCCTGNTASTQNNQFVQGSYPHTPLTAGVVQYGNYDITAEAAV